VDETISREATMAAIDKYLIGRELNTDGEILARILNETVIKRLQPVTPRRGRWMQTAYQIERICSCCGHVEPYKFAEDDVDIYNFCPHCGADMRGGQDEHRARETNIALEKMIVESLPSVYPMMQRFEEEAIKTILDALPSWIPCKERQPSKTGRYFAWAVIECVPDHVDDPGTYEGMVIAYYEIEGNGGVWFGPRTQRVIAWMPLPEDYKEVDMGGKQNA
jgi:hypothetical protein